MTSLLAQQMPLSVAAHLARTQLTREPLKRYDTEQLFEILDAVASALIKAAPLYVCESPATQPRELTALELDGATVVEGGRALLLADGRTMTGVSVTRAGLRDAIAVLRALGIPELGPPPPKPKARLGDDPAATVVELERLLAPPLVPPQLEQANALLIAIARDSKVAAAANLAMRLMSALYDSRGKDALPDSIPLLLAQLRFALPQPVNLPR